MADQDTKPADDKGEDEVEGHQYTELTPGEKPQVQTAKTGDEDDVEGHEHTA